jgi:ABC-2 type transport system permease protein
VISVIKLRLLRLRDDFWVYLLMMAMAFGLTVVFGVSFHDNKTAVLIVDDNKSSYSKELKEQLAMDEVFRFLTADRSTAVTDVQEGKAIAAVTIGDDFDAAVEKGGAVPLSMMKQKEDTILLTLNERLTGTVSRMAGGIRISDITADYIHSRLPQTDRQVIKEAAFDSVMEAWEFKNPISVLAETGPSSSGGYDNLKHSMIGFSLFFSMYTIVFGIGTILYDKQYKTWQRMLITPVSRSAILGGTSVTAYLTGMIQLGILIIAGKYLLDIDWGSSMAGILLVAGAFAFSVTAMGLFLSGIVKTHAQLSAITPVILTSTSMLGGCMWPLDIVNNKFLLILAQFTPQKWALQGMEDIASYGMGFESALIPALVLLVMGAAFFAAGVKLVKQE